MSLTERVRALFLAPEVQARFWAKVDDRSAWGCWPWLASKRTGYGQFCVKSGTTPAPAHRVSYETLVGPIPDGMVLDHLCRNRSCVNPLHLRVCTFQENLLDRYSLSVAAINKHKTHCHRGHPFISETTRIRPNGRECKVCAHLQYLERRKHNPERLF